MVIKSYRELLTQYASVTHLVTTVKVKAVSRIHRSHKAHDAIVDFVNELRQQDETGQCSELDILEAALSAGPVSKKQALTLLGELFPLV